MAETQFPMMPSLVFVPNLRVDRGMGHLRRCLDAAAKAGNGAAVFWSDDPVFSSGRPVFERSAVQDLADKAGVLLWDFWPQETLVESVVADLQTSSLAVFRYLRPRSVRLIGWDAGGEARSWFPFLIDSLPHQTKPEPNVRLPGLLALPVPSAFPRFDRPIRRILAVFGGADPAGLTLRFLAMVNLLQRKGRWPFDLTVVRGPLSRIAVPPSVKSVDSPSHLGELLSQSDLTVTSWGLTALESLALGTPVLLLNPTNYHERLSRRAGLPTFGVKRPRLGAFWSGLSAAAPAAQSCADSLLRGSQDAGAYFARFHGSDGRCPVCRTGGHRVSPGQNTKSYHRCGVCGMEYLSFISFPQKLTPKPISSRITSDSTARPTWKISPTSRLWAASAWSS